LFESEQQNFSYIDYQRFEDLIIKIILIFIGRMLELRAQYLDDNATDGSGEPGTPAELGTGNKGCGSGFFEFESGYLIPSFFIFYTKS
jgi:hypothetical protein